jgi:hypothetical protein
MKDRFDLPLSASSAEALDDYVAAVDLFLSANPGAEERLGHAIAADPDFALAHIARARLFQLQARMPEAREAAARAKLLRESISAREQIAYLRSQQADKAAALLRTRLGRRPSPRDEAWLAQCG